MQKGSDERTGKTEMTQEEFEQFREFFTTSVAQVPEEMTGRVPEKAPKISGGLFQRLFHKKDGEGAPAESATGELTLPTGEVLLDDAADETGDMLLTPVDEDGEPRWEEPDGEPAPAEEAVPEPEPAEEPEPPLPAEQPAKAAKQAPAPAAVRPSRPQKPAAARLSAPEEDQGLLELKELLDAVQDGRKGKPAKPAAEPDLPDVRPFFAGIEEAEPETEIRLLPLEPEEKAGLTPPEPAAALGQATDGAAAAPAEERAAAPVPVGQPLAETAAVRAGKTAETAAAPAKEIMSETAAAPVGEPMDNAAAAPVKEPAAEAIAVPAEEAAETVLPSAGPQPEGVPEAQNVPEEEPSKKERWERLFQMFGAGEDEAPQKPAPDGQEEDTLSLPLLEVEVEPAVPDEPKAEETAPAGPEQRPENEPKDGPETADGEAGEPQSDEEIGQNLQHMRARLTLRCTLNGILAAALLGLGLMAEGLLPASGALDPIGAPVAFMGANLLLLLVAVGVSFGTVREGLAGLFGRPSSDSLPAVAAVAALVQAVAALMNAETYRASGLTLMSGMAALLLFLHALGSRVQLAAVLGNYEIISCGVNHSGAYRVRDRDLIRCLADGLGEKDPWILLSRPVEWASNFIEQSFSERTSERMARRMARILAVAGLLSGLVLLILGRGAAAAASAMATVACMGAPLSATLVAGLSSLRMQRTAGAVGAVIPGWAAVEELGGIDTVQVDARDLFTPECAQLEDIRVFKGGRIDKDILYAASVLSEGCNTLSGLFRQIIAEQTSILLPVRDLEKRRGLGFAAWCDNCRILVGTREMMEREGVALPEQEYEDKHSRNGELQVLYLAVSGSLHAMFLLKYAGGRHAARGLSILQRENVRLLVACDDPTLTAQRISEVYRLPEGLVRVMTEEQCQAVAPAVAYAPDAPCCMVHLQGFASLTGGLRAAARAQTAEQSGTTVQLVSVCISVAIGLLLTYAGNVGTLSLGAVLMYQAAWSALSLALTVLKQH